MTSRVVPGEQHAENAPSFVPTTKRCPTCAVTKTAAAFGPNRTKRDGLQTQCRACRYPTSDAWQARKLSEDAEFRQARARRGTAYTRVRNALRSGRLVRPETCEQCGQPGNDLQAHHWHGDYVARALEVRWLCTSCHGMAHRNGAEHGA